jgi:ATP-binding cassette, subfamily B, multidrug efflux pump
MSSTSENARRKGPMGPGHFTPKEKPNDFKSSLSKLFAYLGFYRKYVIIAIILAILGTILTLFGPNMIGEITDEITEGIKSGNMDMDRITSIGIFLVVLYSIGSLLTYLQNYILATISQKTAKKLRTEISEKINRLPLRYLDKASNGDVLSRVTNDVDTLGHSMSFSMSTIVTGTTMLIGSLVMMAYTNITMMAAGVLSTIFGFVLMIVIISRSQKYFSSQQKNLGMMNGHVEEIYSAHNIVKAYNGQEKAKKDFDTINKNLFDSSLKSQFFSGLMMPLMTFIGNLGYVVVCVVGAILVIDGSISFGIIVAFMIYIRLFTQPLSQIAQAFTSLQSVAAASERIFAFIDEEEQEDETDKTKRLKDVKGDVEFKNVCFGYVPDKEIIHEFSVKVSAGQKVAIVGPTGAGKTTIVNLLMRFYDIKSGEILIDGVSVDEVPRENVHEQFCMVLQDTWLFNGTIRENVAYSKEGITNEQIEDSCKMVGIHHFIMTLPKGYDTLLDEKTNLSMGQRQQLTIARAMIQNSPLLILDEATSSVDTRTEKVIQEAMDNLTKNKTSFVIAHRLSTIKNSDLILVMKNGSIIEKGTHAELLQRNGVYRELYDSQFENVEIA